MKLDPRTIIFIIIIGSLLMSGAMFAVTRGYLGQVAGVKRWAKATLILGFGWLISGVLRGVIPEAISVTLGNALISLALWQYLSIFAKFKQVAFDERWIWWGVGLQAALMFWLVQVQPHFSLRLIVYQTFMVFVMLKSAQVLLHKQGVQMRAQAVTAAMYLLCALVLFGRIIYFLFFNFSANHIPFQQNLLNDISYLVFYIFSVFLTFSYILICNESYFHQRAEEARAVREEFEQALREQRRVENLKSEFISVISHELRTPLTSIRGTLGLLEGGAVGNLPPQALHLIGIAARNSQRLMSLVNDILDMEKLASGKMKLNIERVDLMALVRQAMEANQAYAQSHDVEYVLQDELAYAWVNGDAERLMQVLANLMSNAAKFSRPTTQIFLRVLRVEDGYRVEVEDHGMGISDQFRAHIFGKFSQADSSDVRNLQGAGLGLNISKSLIEQMNGKIGFESEINCGSVFWFSLSAA
jgi:signal transduction histidine kinase